MRCLALFFCIGLYICECAGAVSDIWHTDFPLASCQCDTELSSCVSKCLVTNNCKVTPRVPSKKDLWWKNSQPHNETVASCFLICRRLKYRQFTQTVRLFYVPTARILSKLIIFKVYEVAWKWAFMDVSDPCWNVWAAAHLPLCWTAQTQAVPRICFKPDPSWVWPVICGCGNGTDVPAQPVIMHPISAGLIWTLQDFLG